MLRNNISRTNQKGLERYKYDYLHSKLRERCPDYNFVKKLATLCHGTSRTRVSGALRQIRRYLIDDF
jgi:hypothetical protein